MGIIFISYIMSLKQVKDKKRIWKSGNNIVEEKLKTDD